MRSSVKAFLLSAALCTAMGPAFAKEEPLRLKPSTKWLSQWQDDGCRLVRQFGTGDEKVIAAFARYGPSDDFQLSFGGKPVKARWPAKTKKLQTRKLRKGGGVNVKFGPNGEDQEFFYQIGSLGKKYPGFIIASARLVPLDEAQKQRQKEWKLGPPGIDLAEITGAEKTAMTDITISGRPIKRPVVLETGSLKGPFAVFDKCMDELMTHWGIDVEKHKQLGRWATPATDYRKWVRSGDYPKKMLRAGQPAIVEFRLSVNQEGKASQCHIQATTRAKEFDSAVCRALMKRAAFHPALDVKGNPINSFWRNRVSFQIPRRN